MTPTVPRQLDLGRIKLLYEFAEERYLRSLPLEHFMEATAQGTQRKITLESFDLIHESRPEVQCFNELLVQYPKPGHDPEKPGQIVPDNMVVVHSEPIKAVGSYNTPLQPVGPLLVLEYVSKYNKRKDYEISYEKYEKELQVPYYLLFYPDASELRVFRLIDGHYITLSSNDAGRLAIAELELEVALLDGWVRYWFRGELLPLPGELLQQLNAATERLNTAMTKLSGTEAELAAARKANEAMESELARLRDQLKAKG